MEQRQRAVAACGGIVLIFLTVQVGALALVEPFKQQGHQFVQDTSDPTISVLYIGAILVATALMLAAFRYGVDGIIRFFIVFSGAYIAWYVFQVLFPPVALGGLGEVNVFAYLGGLLIFAGLYLYPEWYVIDATGVVMGIGAAGLFGINFGILPALVLLTVLAVYDAISVYGTEHMLDLASGVMDLRVPVVLVVPLSLSYTFLDTDEENTDEDSTDDETEGAVADGAGADSEAEATEADEADEANDAEEAGERPGLADRDALFIGLGDAVIPTVLIASAAFFIRDVPTLALPGLSIPLPAGTAMVGTLAGLVILLWMVLKGRAHAGLPLLNGGAISGYLVGALASGIPLAEALGITGLL
jgi:presenilin-like A22 family membrane protease